VQVTAYRSFIAMLGVGVALWLLVPWGDVAWWAASQQRTIQNAMAIALHAVGAGEPTALFELCLATALYGFVHAIGPGHGKVLIGGAALATGARFRQLAILTLLSSLAQAGTAIFLVGALVFGIRMSAQDATALTETWLAPLSAAAIAVIGGVLVVRGMRAFHRLRQEPADLDHHPGESCGCGHAHAPGIDDLHALRSTRNAAAIIASIAIRPCTGALFVLVIAARFDAFVAGCLAVLAMALGTAAATLSVAAGGRLARVFSVLGQEAGSAHALRLSAMLHMLGGGMILGLSLLYLAPRLI
jgi:ABC-type nickel/cobalt efflux system permease component RcnA